MPYKSNQDLPDNIKNSLPSAAQDIFRNAFNSANKQGKDEETCNKIAWGAVKNSFQKEVDKWVKKEEGFTLENQEIFSVGTWNGDRYTEDDLNDIVSNFEQLKYDIKPMLHLGHSRAKEDGNPALGWVSKLSKIGNKLVASFSQVPDVVYKAIKKGLYKRVSSEMIWNYKRGDKLHKRVLAGVALLGADIPAVTNLKDLEIYRNFETIKSYSFEIDDFGNLQTKGGLTMADNEKIKEYELKLSQTSLELEREKAQKTKAEDELKSIRLSLLSLKNKLRQKKKKLDWLK